MESRMMEILLSSGYEDGCRGGGSNVVVIL